MPSTDNSYENAFANIAYPRIQDKAPSLINHLLGFQLIDKGDDDTRAIGTFVFKVGKEIVMAPLFFLNGELKGHDLMFLKSRDQFVPLEEGWVNYVLNRRPPVMGESETIPRDQIGLRQPNFDVFSRPPSTGVKFAEYAGRFTGRSYHDLYKNADENVQALLNAFVVLPTDDRYAGLSDRLDLGNALSRLPKAASLRLFKTMEHSEKFADAIVRFYDPADLVKAAEKIRVEYDDVPYKDTPKAKIVFVSKEDAPPGPLWDYSDREKEKLSRDGWLIRDDRDETRKSEVYTIRMSTKFITPDLSGLYEVLTASGKTRPMYVVSNPIRVGYAFGRREPSVVVIDKETKAFGQYGSHDVLTVGKQSLLKADSPGLSDPKSLVVDDLALLVGPTGQCTNVFRVTNKYGRPDGTTELSVDGYLSLSPGSTPLSFRGVTMPGSSVSEDVVDSIILTGRKSNQEIRVGRALFIPGTFKALEVKKHDAEQHKKDQENNRYISPQDRSNPSIALGSLNDVIDHITKAAGWVRPMRLLADGGGNYAIEIAGVQKPMMPKVAAIKALTLGLGLRVEDAEEILGETKAGEASEHLVKFAYDPPNQAMFLDPPQTWEHGSRAPTQESFGMTQTLGQTDNAAAYEKHRNDPYVDEAAQQFAQQAAGSGQKEVVDIATLSGLVKTMDIGEQLDSWLPALMRTLDRLGRILFQYYWHNDKYKERYGQQDMATLEDNIRNVFKNLGEVVLFLKQKTVEPSMAQGGEPELTEVLG